MTRAPKIPMRMVLSILLPVLPLTSAALSRAELDAFKRRVEIAACKTYLREVRMSKLDRTSPEYKALLGEIQEERASEGKGENAITFDSLSEQERSEVTVEMIASVNRCKEKAGIPGPPLRLEQFFISH